jgi:hypothetical protein
MSAAACPSGSLTVVIWIGGALLFAFAYFAVQAYRRMEWTERTDLLAGSAGVGLVGLVVAVVLTQALA